MNKPLIVPIAGKARHARLLLLICLHESLAGLTDAASKVGRANAGKLKAVLRRLMMEIKFRAYRKDKGIMMYFDLDDIASTTAYNGWSNYIFKGDGEDRKGIDIVDDNDVVVMQYTGLKDKNGKGIYEGDIVKVYTWVSDGPDSYKNCIGKGVIELYQGKYVIKEYQTIHGLSDYFWDGGNDLLEIIGNKYENPELLKEEANDE